MQERHRIKNKVGYLGEAEYSGTCREDIEYSCCFFNLKEIKKIEELPEFS
jgi:hypothetical protein